MKVMLGKSIIGYGKQGDIIEVEDLAEFGALPFSSKHSILADDIEETKKTKKTKTKKTDKEE